MFLLDLVDWVLHNPGEAIIRGLLLVVARNLIVLAKEEEVHWLKEQVERLTGERYPGHTKQLWRRAVRSSKRLSSLSQTGMCPENHFRRRLTMKTFLSSSSFRRWLSFIIATIIPFINQRFGLNLDPNEVLGIIILAMAHILGEAHFDGKKAVNAATTAINSALQASSVPTAGQSIPIVNAPQMSYQDIAPYASEVHKAVNDALDAIKSGKYNDATQQANDFYLTVHTYLQMVEAKQQQGQKGA